MPGFFPAPGPTQLLATAGGVINGSNLTIFTTPSGGAGSPMLEANGAGSAIYLDINGAGVITGSGSTLTENVFGGGSVFLQAQNSGLIEAYDLTQLFPTGGNDIGAQALTGGTIILIGGSLTVDSGGGNFGLQANGGTITTNGTTINLGTPSSPNGGSDVGAEAIGGGTLRLTNSSVNIFGSGGSNTGLLASGASSTITTTNANVTMENPLNPPHVDVDTGVEAAAGGVVTMTGGTVAVNGIGSGEKGLWATGAGSTINASDIAISVPNGNNSAGVQADTSGAITLTSNSSIATGGTNTPGGLLMNGGTLSMTGGSVTTTGPSSNGFTISGGAPADTLALANVTVSASQGNSFNVNGPTANIMLTDTTAIVNNGTVLLTQGGGTTTLTASGSTLEGVMTTIAGSTANVTLQNATTWTMTGSSNVTNLTNDDSLIDYTAPSNGAFKTLTAVNYTGEGGTIGLNTYLGTDGSPSDLLVINGGTATGSTVLHITNADGPGAATQANGIEVVSAINGATTASGAFSLGGQEVRAGAFDYDLFQGGVGGSDPQDWFLRSDFAVPPAPGEPEPPGPPEPGTELPEDPPPSALPPGEYPIIGPEIATYGVVQPIARQLGLATLGTLHDRIGDTLLDELAPCLAGAGDEVVRRDGGTPTWARRAEDCGDGWRPSAWGRAFGESIDNRYLAFIDPSASGQLVGFQAGLDLWRGSFAPGHRDVAGLYFSYANANVDVSGLVTNAAATDYVLEHTGHLNLNGWSAGAYWTHYGPSGWYLDAVAQATRYDGWAGTQFTGLDPAGTGVIGSLEAGYPFALPAFGPGFVLEPQAQIIGQHVQFDDTNDEFGDVALGTTNGATGRVGARARWTLVNAQGQEWQPYLRANFWRDWGGDATTVYSGVDQVPLLEEAERLELGGGLTVKIDSEFSLYANGDYQSAVGDTDGGKREGVRGALGLRYAW